VLIRCHIAVAAAIPSAFAWRAMRFFKFLPALITLAALPAVLHAQPVPYWSTTDPRPLNYWVNATAAAFNASGDGFVLGSTQDFPGDSGDPLDVNGIRLTKFSPTGEVLWANEISRPTQYGPVQTTVIPTPDAGALTYVDWETGLRFDDLVVTKYGPNGNVQWSNTSDICPSVASDGSVFIGGSFEGDNVVTKLNAQGTSVWSKSFVLDNSGFGALRADASGGVWAAGSLFVNGVPQLYLGHYDSSGNLQTWTYPTASVGAIHIDIDSGGNLILGGVKSVNNSSQVIALAKVSSGASLLWSHIYTDAIDFGYSEKRPTFSIDPAGNAFVGYNSSSSPHPQIMKVDSTGTTAWTRTYAPTNTATAFIDLLADPGGNLFALFRVSAITSPNQNYALMKFLPNGDLGWPSLSDGAIIYDSGTLDSGAQGGGDYPAGLGRDSAGYLYVGGLGLLSSRNGHHVIKYGPANNAFFNSQSIPTSMIAGQTYAVSLNFANTGVNTWTLGDNYFLRSANPTDNTTWGLKRVDLSPTETILAGQAKSFKFNAIAPMNGGNYNFQWRMSQGTGAFGGASANVSIPVVVKQHAARYISQSVPTSAKAGATFSVTVTMRNVGTNTWTKASGYALASIEPDLNTRWGISTVPLGIADSIARGQNKVFTFNCVAPASPGTYTMRWIMHRQASAFTGFFGDKTTTKTITVTP
jgi:hypothetical protein